AAADVVVTRSGASSVSELCAARKAAIFVPSPNVTEDHQTHNAMALVHKDAGMIVTDSQAREKLMGTACALAKDGARTAVLEKNIAALAKTEAAQEIVDEIYKLI
ncbi:MAG: glycosyltransferase, partial [Candidatus Cryptobacteroides sp.]